MGEVKKKGKEQYHVSMNEWMEGGGHVTHPPLSSIQIHSGKSELGGGRGDKHTMLNAHHPRQSLVWLLIADIFEIDGTRGDGEGERIGANFRPKIGSISRRI